MGVHFFSHGSTLPRTEGLYTATVLFCDIRGFTRLFDDREPGEALKFANAVLGELGSTIEACNGTLDKFTGDGFLAHFGIDQSETDHVIDACQAAVEIRKALMKINTQRFIVNQPVIAAGVGIHSGAVAAGYVRTMAKREFTVLGSTVNLASRIEGLTKFFSVDCLVSSGVERHAKKQFQFQNMPIQSLRGVSQPQETFWLLPTNI